jgi:MoaA/NifB/PqqE/SkfB family radical SAM enzyme
MIEKDELLQLEGVIREIKNRKGRPGHLSSSRYYLDRIPEFFEKRGIPGCTAGLNWIQVTPDGLIKRCPDHPIAGHFSEWRDGFFKPTDCDRCWYSCRGAAQEPWTIRRFIEMAKETLVSSKSARK